MTLHRRITHLEQRLPDPLTVFIRKLTPASDGRGCHAAFEGLAIARWSSEPADEFRARVRHEVQMARPARPMYVVALHEGHLEHATQPQGAR